MRSPGSLDACSLEDAIPLHGPGSVTGILRIEPKKETPGVIPSARVSSAERRDCALNGVSGLTR